MASIVKDNKDNKEGKENKDAKDAKDGGGKKNKDDSGGNLHKRILSELAVLRAEVDALKAARQAISVPPIEPAKSPLRNRAEPKNDEGGKSFLQGLRDAVGESKKEAYVAVAHAYRREGDDGKAVGSNDLCVHGGLSGILSVSDAHAARLGQAFSAPQKIALLRVLIEGGPQSGAQLEEKAHLTTGSLYHHLRELLHAHVVENAGRSRYQMTDLGLQSALVLFVQAARVNERG